MRRYGVFSIKDIIDNYKSLKKGKTVVIFISKKYYTPRYIGFRPNLQLNFLDVNKDEERFIREKHLKSIKTLLPTLRDADTIIVGCDAGVSRSPAVALGIAYHLGDKEQMKDLWHDFRFTNIDVYKAIKKM